jgi:hypothetical protein
MPFIKTIFALFFFISTVHAKDRLRGAQASSCPPTAPFGAECTTDQDGLECSYDYINIPVEIDRETGECSNDTNCVATAGCACSDGDWMCFTFALTPCTIGNKRPGKIYEACKPKP